MWWSNKHNLMFKRWRLRHSLADHNDHYRVELPRAVEVLAKKCEKKSSYNFVSHGNKTECSRNGTNKGRAGFLIYAGDV